MNNGHALEMIQTGLVPEPTRQMEEAQEDQQQRIPDGWRYLRRRK